MVKKQETGTIIKEEFDYCPSFLFVGTKSTRPCMIKVSGINQKGSESLMFKIDTLNHTILTLDIEQFIP
ncbi:hypothetical protein [Enterococcus villorum]|uniref:Uncharacterized protein n=2 Tax=Enterococcus villorum TaxID=112904 RepID=A0A511J406_9ENTE|nr:hypothetical protein UAO_01235 [Enterococcus villorum ATCC 700913]EOW78223.1 hypothetical protein I591_01078 [Enterococcus villorum ATCC 700913]GEL92748.1 hypothetical protein EVI01_20850 [Enterococcus villorum]